MAPPPEAIDRLLNAAAAGLHDDTIKALTRGSVIASAEGQEHAAASLGVSLNFNLVNSYAMKKAIEYRDLLIRKGGSMIGGEFKPWLADSIEVDRQAVSSIVTKGIEEGKTLRDLRKELDTVFTQGEHNSALVAYQETKRILSDGTDARWQQEGVEEAEWIHMDPQQDPRPEHQALDGKVFALTDPVWNKQDEYNCHCSKRPIIPGLIAVRAARGGG
jgi:SPP1 gp7 family putative phage head morphogenesis protein